jgi:hypothetical protein
MMGLWDGRELVAVALLGALAAAVAPTAFGQAGYQPPVLPGLDSPITGPDPAAVPNIEPAAALPRDPFSRPLSVPGAAGGGVAPRAQDDPTRPAAASELGWQRPGGSGAARQSAPPVAAPPAAAPPAAEPPYAGPAAGQAPLQKYVLTACNAAFHLIGGEGTLHYRLHHCGNTECDVADCPRSYLAAIIFDKATAEHLYYKPHFGDPATTGWRIARHADCLGRYGVERLTRAGWQPFGAFGLEIPR